MSLWDCTPLSCALPIVSKDQCTVFLLWKQEIKSRLSPELTGREKPCPPHARIEYWLWDFTCKNKISTSLWEKAPSFGLPAPPCPSLSWPFASTADSRQTRKMWKRKSQRRKDADRTANSTNPYTTPLRAAAQEPRKPHVPCGTWISTSYCNRFSKYSLLNFKLLRVGSLSSLYCQSFVSPSTALHQLLMFILSSNGKNSPLRLRPLSPYSAFSSPFYSIHVAKMIFLQLKIWSYFSEV